MWGIPSGTGRSGIKENSPTYTSPHHAKWYECNTVPLKQEKIIIKKPFPTIVHFLSEILSNKEGISFIVFFTISLFFSPWLVNIPKVASRECVNLLVYPDFICNSVFELHHNRHVGFIKHFTNYCHAAETMTVTG